MVVVVEVTVVVVVLPLEVGAGLPDFGRYFMPVEGQLEVDPEGATGIKVPDLGREVRSQMSFSKPGLPEVNISRTMIIFGTM